MCKAGWDIPQRTCSCSYSTSCFYKISTQGAEYKCTSPFLTKCAEVFDLDMKKMWSSPMDVCLINWVRMQGGGKLTQPLTRGRFPEIFFALIRLQSTQIRQSHATICQCAPSPALLACVFGNYLLNVNHIGVTQPDFLIWPSKLLRIECDSLRAALG